MLKAAGLPLGEDTFTAHEKLLKHWPGDGERWKQTCEVFLKSPLAVTGRAPGKEEAAQERLVFNRHILLNGTNPVGGQQATKGLWETRLGDLVAADSSGAAVMKDLETLGKELRGKESAWLALKAWEAAPQEWKELLVPVAAQGETGGDCGNSTCRQAAPPVALQLPGTWQLLSSVSWSLANVLTVAPADLVDVLSAIQAGANGQLYIGFTGNNSSSSGKLVGGRL
ncbi:unnamed protein product [Closterium sp. Naga37s-1]|nr:unnamed protein product [Closterium sp. Naga37s-1]